MIEEATSPGIQKLEQAPAVPVIPAEPCESGADGAGSVQAEAPGGRPLDLVGYDEAALMVDRHRNRIRAWVREGQLRSWSEEPDRPNAKRLVSRSELMRLVVVTGKAAHPGGPGRGEPAETSALADDPPPASVAPTQAAPVALTQAAPVALTQAAPPVAQVAPVQATPIQAAPPVTPVAPQPVAPQPVAPPVAPVRGMAQESVALAHLRLDAERAKVGMLEALVQAERQRAEALERALHAERERAETERLRGADWRDRATALQAEVEALRAERGLPWWRRLLTG